jgi:hypothetical protein
MERSEANEPNRNATGAAASNSGETRVRFGEAALEALRYWEPRRFLYNAILLAVVVAHFWSRWPASKSILRLDVLLELFLFAVLANIAYCAAYAVDLFVQFSGARAAWTRWRWTVFATGAAFAAVLAHFITMGVFVG